MDPVAILAKPGVAVAARNAPTAQRGATKIRQDWSPVSPAQKDGTRMSGVHKHVTNVQRANSKAARWGRTATTA